MDGRAVNLTTSKGAVGGMKSPVQNGDMLAEVASPNPASATQQVWLHRTLLSDNTYLQLCNALNDKLT